MPLDTEVGLGPGYIVLVGTQLPPKNGHSPPPPVFGPCLLWPNSWMDQDVIWYGGRPRPTQNCVRWEASFLPKGHSLHNFQPMSVVAKRLDGSRCHLVWR